MNTKFSAILLAALLLLSAASGALAATANATVVAPETVKMTAPMNGTLLPFDLVSGERVAAGDALFAFINGVVEMLARIFLPMLMVLIPSVGMWGIWWTAGLAWFISAVFCMLRYISWRKKTNATVG